MKVWANNTFKGHNPVGSAAVVVAESQEEAAGMLAMALDAVWLKQDVDPESMKEIPLGQKGVNILVDGEY